MPRFVCQHCGMVNEHPEIVPLPDEDTRFRELRKMVGASSIVPPYNHAIYCPVCLGETTFWRESLFPLAPLPTDGRINLDGSPFSLSVKAMLSDMNL